ncbi:hypothetical protein MRX96_030560 [Rhipicephalus microplus]
MGLLATKFFPYLKVLCDIRVLTAVTCYEESSPPQRVCVRSHKRKSPAGDRPTGDNPQRLSGSPPASTLSLARSSVSLACRATTG